MMVGADERLRLELVDQCIRGVEPPRRIGPIPPAVEPDAADLAVVGQQLAQLPVHVLDVPRPLALFRPPGVAAGAAARKVIGVMPVELRVVEEQLEALLSALLGERLEDIFLVRRSRDDVVVGHPGVEHREAVVMLARDGDVLHARGLRERNPLGRIERHRIELRRQLLVIGDGDSPVVHDPLTVAEHAVDAPVHEQAEARVLEPAARRQVRRARAIPCLGAPALADRQRCRARHQHHRHPCRLLHGRILLHARLKASRSECRSTEQHVKKLR